MNLRNLVWHGLRVFGFGFSQHTFRRRVLTEVEEYNRGSAENPMSADELRAKFDDNAGGFLSASQRDRLALEIARAENLPDARTIVNLVTA